MNRSLQLYVSHMNTSDLFSGTFPQIRSSGEPIININWVSSIPRQSDPQMSVLGKVIPKCCQFTGKMIPKCQFPGRMIPKCRQFPGRVIWKCHQFPGKALFPRQSDPQMSSIPRQSNPKMLSIPRQRDTKMSPILRQNDPKMSSIPKSISRQWSQIFDSNLRKNVCLFVELADHAHKKWGDMSGQSSLPTCLNATRMENTLQNLRCGFSFQTASDGNRTWTHAIWDRAEDNARRNANSSGQAVSSSMQ